MKLLDTCGEAVLLSYKLIYGIYAVMIGVFSVSLFLIVYIRIPVKMQNIGRNASSERAASHKRRKLYKLKNPSSAFHDMTSLSHTTGVKSKTKIFRV